MIHFPFAQNCLHERMKHPPQSSSSLTSLIVGCFPQVILEWHGANGEPAPKPLLKNAFALERRRAKVLNFSIAYGKTALGLAKDWGVSLDEAKQTLEYWYNDRPEVCI